MAAATAEMRTFWCSSTTVAPINPQFMEEAVQEAINGMTQGKGGPFGAVIVQDGKIVAKGHNQVLHDCDPTAHAEITVIRRACENLQKYDLSGCVLYTSCYPCPMCMGAALWARLDAIYYGATSAEAAAVGFSDAEFHEFLKNPKSDSKRSLECIKLDDVTRPFRIWHEMENKQPY
ncbi:unnamed protein product, partial [Mesorhabditis belari]|uniref:CMP/dCMP-type deaminase domain-containing protein n=1 Tax=Mesorhabditis belari TaxID=2138241 RepID=A0AAF3J9Q0_9BILA